MDLSDRLKKAREELARQQEEFARSQAYSQMDAERLKKSRKELTRKQKDISIPQEDSQMDVDRLQKTRDELGCDEEYDPFSERPDTIVTEEPEDGTDYSLDSPESNVPELVPVPYIPNKTSSPQLPNAKHYEFISIEEIFSGKSVDPKELISNKTIDIEKIIIKQSNIEKIIGNIYETYDIKFNESLYSEKLKEMMKKKDEDYF